VVLYIVTSVLLKPLKQHLFDITCSDFQNTSFSILDLFFQIFGSYNVQDQIPDTHQLSFFFFFHFLFSVSLKLFL